MLEIRALDTATLAQLAPVIEGKPDVKRIAEIDLTELGRKFRMQKIIFQTARDHDENVDAWVKNDHLGIEILYVYNGVVRKFRPDFIIRLANGKMLVLEIKGQDVQQDPWESGDMSNQPRKMSDIMQEMAERLIRDPEAAPSSEAVHVALFFANVAWNECVGLDHAMAWCEPGTRSRLLASRKRRGACRVRRPRCWWQSVRGTWA